MHNIGVMLINDCYHQPRLFVFSMMLLTLSGRPMHKSEVDKSLALQ